MHVHNSPHPNPRQLDCCSRRNSTSPIHGVVLPALLSTASSRRGLPRPSMGSYLLGGCSRRRSTSSIHGVVGGCSRRRSRQLLLHCSPFAHPWARTSSIHGVVHPCSRLLQAGEGELVPREGREMNLILVNLAGLVL